MHETILRMMKTLGLNVGFANNCLDAGRLTEDDLLSAITGITGCTSDDKAKVHALNREIWRLRNLRRRNFDRESFARDVVIGLGFNIDVVDYARATGKVTAEAFEKMVVGVCRGKMTVAEAQEALKPTEVVPVTADKAEGKAADAGFSIEELVGMGFHHDVLSRCVHSGAVSWDEIDAQARRVRGGKVSAVEVEAGLVNRACNRLSFPRACQLRERLVRQAGRELRWAA